MLDSLIPVSLLPQKGKMADLGSGAGFPAIVVKIMRPDLDMRLIDANGKKVSFMKYAIRELKLRNIAAVHSRLEAVADEIRCWGCDIVSSRAMAGLDKIIPMAAPFLVPNGIIAGFLGKNGKEELNDIHRILLEYNLELTESVTYTLPEKQSERTTVILKKSVTSGI